MKFSVADLLDHLPESDVLPVEQLEKALGLSLTPDKQHLRIALAGL